MLDAPILNKINEYTRVKLGDRVVIGNNLLPLSLYCDYTRNSIDSSYTSVNYSMNHSIKYLVGSIISNEIEYTADNSVTNFSTGYTSILLFTTVSQCDYYLANCFKQLRLNGELVIVINPGLFMYRRAAAILDNMYAHGSFTDIYEPPGIYTVIRYQKTASMSKQVIYNDVEMKLINNGGILCKFPISNLRTGEMLNKLSHYFDVYSGVRTGAKNIFRTNIGNIKLLVGKNKREKYIRINEYPSNCAKINRYLEKHKETLTTKHHSDNIWFKWFFDGGAPEYTHGKDCIYIAQSGPSVAFIGKVEWFTNNLIALVPKCDCDLYRIADYLNSKAFTENYETNNRFRISIYLLRNAMMADSLFHSPEIMQNTQEESQLKTQLFNDYLSGDQYIAEFDLLNASNGCHEDFSPIDFDTL